MLDYQSTDDCRMVFLRAQLDDPELTEGALCGRCDNCAGVRYSADVGTTAVDSARNQLQRPGVELAQAMAVRHDEAGRGRQWPDR
jgi:ATP-dependent DNA helicase RecQ